MHFPADKRSTSRKKKNYFRDLLTKFEELHLPTISEGTKRRYQLDITHRIQPYFQDYELHRIAQLTIESFRSHLVGALSPKSVNNCTDLLALIFNKGVQWGLLEQSPMKLRKLRLPEANYSWWDNKEAIRDFLQEAKKTQYYAAYLLALECGLRLGEIVGLSKQDVDLKRCQINIHRQWLEAQGKLGPTKGRTQRFINFSPDSDLKNALAKAILSSPDREAIFVTNTGRRIRATKLRCKLLPMLIRNSGVPSIRFHDLRHTFASWYMIEHDDIWTLMRLLGHSDIQTTQRYAHFSSQHPSAANLNWSK